MRYMHVTILGIMLVSPAMVQGQYAVSATYPTYGPSGYGYYGGGYHSSTVAEGHGRGVADVIRSHALYHQLSADAAVRMHEAHRLHIANYKQAVDTYFYVREQNRTRRAADKAARRRKSIEYRKRRKTPQVVRLSETQFSRQTGTIKWPTVLMDDAFAAQRVILDKLLAKRAKQGDLYAIDDRKAVKTATDTLFKKLSERRGDLHVGDRILAKRFIEAISNEVFAAKS